MSASGRSSPTAIRWRDFCRLADHGAPAGLQHSSEFGDRQGTLKFSARFYNNSTELTKLKAQTTGTATILLQFDANNSLLITWQKVSFATAEVGETDQFVTVAVECTPIYDATNGLITAVAKCGVDGICQ